MKRTSSESEDVRFSTVCSTCFASADIIDSRLSGKIFPLSQSDGTALRQVIPGGQGQRVYSPEGASTCLTSQGGGWGAKTGLYLVDMNPNPVITDTARLHQALRRGEVLQGYLAAPSNRRGEHSSVLISDARAVLTPERENVRQQGKRMEEPDEPMILAATVILDVNVIKQIIMVINCLKNIGGWLWKYMAE